MELTIFFTTFGLCWLPGPTIARLALLLSSVRMSPPLTHTLSPPNLVTLPSAFMTTPPSVFIDSLHLELPAIHLGIHVRSCTFLETQLVAFRVLVSTLRFLNWLAI